MSDNRAQRSLPGVNKGIVLRVLVALLALALILTGCGDNKKSSTSTTTEKPAERVSDEQLGRLADVLVNNNTAGGAQVNIAMTVLQDQVISFDGEISWNNPAKPTPIGDLKISTEEKNDALVGLPEEIVFTPTALAAKNGRGTPTVAELAGNPAATWIARPLTGATSGGAQVDVVATMLLKLTSQQRENPVLLEQQGVTLVGTTTVNGIQVEKFKFKSNTVWYVGVDDAKLYRLDATINGFIKPVVFTFSDFGVKEINGPRASEVVTLSELSAAAQAEAEAAMAGQ